MEELVTTMRKLVEKHRMTKVLFALQIIMLDLQDLRRAGVHHTLDAAFKQADDIEMRS